MNNEQSIPSIDDLRIIEILQAIPDMMFRMDGQGVFLDYKADFKDLYARSVPTIIGRRCRDITPPEFAGRVEGYISQSLKTRSLKIFEYELPIPERGVRHYEAHMVPSGDNEVFVMVRDITDKVHMTRALRKERDFTSTILESSIDGILVVDTSGAVLAHNQQFVKIWGIPEKALETGCDDKLLELVRNKLTNPDEFLEKVKWLYKNHQDISRDEIPLSDGRVLDRYSAPVIGKDGCYYGRVWYFRDLTERKQLENELKAHRDHLGSLVAERTIEIQDEINRRTKKEEQYTSIIGSIIEWVWETDVRFVHTYLSPRIFDVLGYRPEELIGKSPVDIMPAGEKMRATPIIRKVFAQREQLVAFQTLHIHKDGRLIFIEANGKPFFDARGQLIGYRGSARDITEHKKTLDALKEREKDLRAKSTNLEEINATLRVLLRQREDDRKELEQKFMSNVKEMVLPYVQKMKKINLEPKYKAYMEIIAANLDQIISPFLGNIRNFNFTPREIEVANLIHDGKTTKEIAEIMGVAPSAVHSHRDNIRKKLGLNNKNINLRSFLQTLK